MNKPWQPYAQHILDAIAKIRRIQARGDLRADEVLYDATLRNLQTLSEAAQNLPEPLQARCQGIPWREICGFRNISCTTTGAISIRQQSRRSSIPIFNHSKTAFGNCWPQTTADPFTG